MKHLILTFLLLSLLGCSGGNSAPGARYEFIRDVRNDRVAAMMGSAVEGCLEAQYPEMKIDRFETETDLVQALKQDRCDAIGLDGYAAHYMNVETGNDFVLLEDSLGSMDLAAAFNKGVNVELRKQFNAFLKEIKGNGVLDKLADKWLNHCETATMPEWVVPTEGKPIKIGTCLTLPPTSYLQGKRPVGLDMELAMGFARFVNRPVELENLVFSSLITSLTTDKIDMVLSSLSITEERAKRVDFSDSYLRYDLVLMVRPEDKVGFDPAVHGGTTKVKEMGFLDGLRESFVNNLIKEKRYEMVLEGLRTTLVISLFSVLLGTILGALVCFLKMRRMALCRTIANVYISVLRGMPVLVLLLIMFYVVFNKVDIDPVLVAVVTFALNFSAYVSEMFRSSIEGIDRGQTEAGIALGFSPARTFYHIVLPQAVRNVLPVYRGEMISLVKMTSVVGYIAVEDLTKVSDIIRSRTFDALFPLVMVAVLYFIIAWLFSVLLDVVSRRFS